MTLLVLVRFAWSAGRRPSSLAREAADAARRALGLDPSRPVSLQLEPIGDRARRRGEQTPQIARVRF